MLITQKGKEQQLKLIAGQTRAFADRFSVGASDDVLTADANDLDLAWGQFAITDAVIDYDAQQVLFYGTIPADFAGEIKEIGLVTSDDSITESRQPANLTLQFSEIENWLSPEDVEPEYASDDATVGSSNLEWNGTEIDQYVAYADYNGINLSHIDEVKLKVISSVSSELKLTLISSETDSSSANIELDAGVNYVKIPISDFTSSENYDSASVKAIMLGALTAGVDYSFDCLVFEKKSLGGLVARETIDAVTKRAGSSMEIEMAVALNV